MAVSKDLPELEADIEHYKQLVREDLAQLNRKFHAALGPLSLTHFMKEHVLALCGAALVVGFIFGYQGVPVADLAKPAVRATLKNGGQARGDSFDSRIENHCRAICSIHVPESANAVALGDWPKGSAN